MKRLLPQLAPATDTWGFLEASFEDVVSWMEEWLYGMNDAWYREDGEGTLKEALKAMEPLNLAPDAVAETRSRWTAVFSGSWSGPDSEIPYLSKARACRGLLVTCVPDTYDPITQCGQWGGVQFCTFAPGKDASVPNNERTVYLVNDCGRWEFGASGPPYPFEETDRYKAKRIRDRFSVDMLERYCGALGIELLDEHFYGPRYAIFQRKDAVPPGYQYETYEAVRKRLRIE